MNKRSGKIKYVVFLLAGVLCLSNACKKWLPDDLDFISPKAAFTQSSFAPILGRTTVYQLVFNPDNSSIPIHFEIANVRDRKTGKKLDDFSKEIPVTVWKEAYTGFERSIDEITAKRAVENHHVWEIRPESGDFVLWAEADSSMLKQQPDSGYLFDVIASNSGGSRTFSDMVLTPLREQPYSPYELDPVTGQKIVEVQGGTFATVKYVHPSSISNITGDSTGLPMVGDSIRVLFHKKGNGNSLTFKFLNKDSTAINPARFNQTVWDSLVHGFNVKVSDTDVRYNVVYPIPVIKYKTRFTNSDGSQASVHFTWDRKGFGGFVQRSIINFDFAIFQKGDWEILFWFRYDNPRFRDE